MIHSTAHFTEPKSPLAIKRHRLCGVPVDELSLEQLVDSFLRLSEPGRKTSLICYLNAHIHNLARRNAELRDMLQRAAIVYPDGAGVVWGCRYHGWQLTGRMTGADILPPLAQRLQQQGRSIFLLGSQPGVAERCATALQAIAPGLQVVGCHHGYFSHHESADVVERIRTAAPDILAVGMGAPRQEKWVRDHWSQLPVPLIWTVGALLDFAAGDERRCPKWMGEHGLEWLYRLWLRPRHMAQRYLLGNPAYVWAVLRHRHHA